MPIETLNEITLIKRLGNGFFGEVHSATLPPHGTIAVKIVQCAKLAKYLNIAPTNWPQMRTALFAEAESLVKAEHQHVVRVYGAQYDATKDNGYVVTELCDGCVASAIQNGPLPLAKVNRYLRHALTGLETLHGRGMLHRDIKPPNILIKGDTAKLSDFGLVTDQLVAGYAARAGYVEFLAPEVFATNQTSFRSDVWSMGLTAYQMLNGEPWHLDVLRSLGADKVSDPAAARARIVQLVRAGGFASKLPFLPHVPDGWRRFVRKAMHDDPHERFENAATMLSAMSSRELPEVPSYECAFAPSGLITWRRPRDDRDEVIVLTRGPKRTNSILAELRAATGGSAPTKVLRRKGNLLAREASEELQRFFAARTS